MYLRCSERCSRYMLFSMMDSLTSGHLFFASPTDIAVFRNFGEDFLLRSYGKRFSADGDATGSTVRDRSSEEKLFRRASWRTMRSVVSSKVTLSWRCGDMGNDLRAALERRISRERRNATSLGSRGRDVRDLEGLFSAAFLYCNATASLPTMCWELRS